MGDELVEYSRRLEAVAVVGGACDRSGGVDRLRPLFVYHHRRFSGRVQAVRVSVLLACSPVAKLDARVRDGADARVVDTARVQGDLLLLPEGLLPGVLLRSAGLPGGRAAEGPLLGREKRGRRVQGGAGALRLEQRTPVLSVRLDHRGGVPVVRGLSDPVRAAGVPDQRRLAVVVLEYRAALGLPVLVPLLPAPHRREQGLLQLYSGWQRATQDLQLREPAQPQASQLGLVQPVLAGGDRSVPEIVADGRHDRLRANPLRRLIERGIVCRETGKTGIASATRRAS